MGPHLQHVGFLMMYFVLLDLSKKLEARSLILTFSSLVALAKSKTLKIKVSLPMRVK
jgi:hypothetical protein